jgi:hypothetical protein
MAATAADRMDGTGACLTKCIPELKENGYACTNSGIPWIASGKSVEMQVEVAVMRNVDQNSPLLNGKVAALCNALQSLYAEQNEHGKSTRKSVGNL